MSTPAEEIRAAATKLRCDHRFPVNPFVDKCQRCGCKWDGRADVPAWLADPLADMFSKMIPAIDEGSPCPPSVLALARAIDGGTP